MNNFIQRTLTGIVFILVVIGSIFHPVSYSVLFLVVIVWSICEFKQMIDNDNSKVQLTSAVLLSLFLFVFSFLVFYRGLEMKWIVFLVPLMWLPFMRELFSKNPKPFRNVGLTFLSVVYITLPLSSLHFLVFKNGIYEFLPLICFFLLVWVNDSGAYLVGVTLGRHKLYERISPKKSVEGFFGGIVFTLVFATLIFYFTQIAELWVWLVAAIVISVIGTAGDLIESMLKRSLNVKDSGRFLPGHGGILDRFDAVLFSAPMVSLLFYYFT